MNELIGIVMLFLLLLLFATGIELGFAMAVIGFMGFAYLNGVPQAMNLLARDMFDVMTNYGYTVFPLFILMGQIGFHTGIAQRLYACSNKFIGHIPGGLAMATVVGGSAFKAICGSATATTATFASVAMPEMDRYGYDKRLSTGVIATVGTLGCLIPPSVVLILYGVITEQSIGRLFLAGVVPATIIALFFMGIIYGWVRMNPAIAPVSERAGWKERVRSLPEVIWVLIIFLLMIGGIMQGFFTPSEAGAVGAFAILILALAKRDLTFRKYLTSLTEAIRTAGMFLMLLAGSAILGHFIAVTNIPQNTAEWLVSLPVNRYLILIGICIIFELGGSFIEDLAFMILALPIFYPTIVKLGFDPIWFAVVICVIIMVGMVIPPVAICVFVVKNITKVPIGQIYRGCAPFLIALIICWGIVLFIPQLSLWLPSLFFK
ncbi:MAG: Sialic acid TRAP transporter permease protein SiaT [Syntrophorhabdaceae bacterium PtaU1.Bin034]|nr:MAG: Sialic acid TRAP transporter permease protein SiaT [Syntrophorhabdaceae bacterium PtaU1.Bin034]